MMRERFQIAVIGSGFGGSLMAMIARRLGFSTVLIERGRHPRFVIGESSTPLANLLLEEICAVYGLPSVRPLCKWGTWQRQLPQIAAGIKRGFTFYHHEFDRTFPTDDPLPQMLMVGASPNEEIADAHWYRPEFDQYLAEQAENLGVTYWDQTELVTAREKSTAMYLAGSRKGQIFEIDADFVIDASGPRGFLFRALGLRETNFREFPSTQALFSHFENVTPFPINHLNGKAPPYPAEQAAIHHVFPGGWIWVLHFNNGLTSAGVAATDAVAHRFAFESGAAGWGRLLERLPSLQSVFHNARATRSFVHLPRLAFQTDCVSGSRWALLPSAAGFVDPLLSTGFPLTLLGITRLACLLRTCWNKPTFATELSAYAQQTFSELATTSSLVRALYATMSNFDAFKQLSLLYFAAASYSEAARRLEKPQLAKGFLLGQQPQFTAQFHEICKQACGMVQADTQQFAAQVRALIEPFDVAGLTDGSRDPLYPALVSDLLRDHSKLHSSAEEVHSLLQRLGMITGGSKAAQP